MLTLLQTIEEEIDALSLHSRALIMAVCNAYGKQPHEFICERYHYCLDLMGCFKSMKDSFMMLQSESTTAPPNVVQAYLTFAETCAQVCSEYNFVQIDNYSEGRLFDFAHPKEHDKPFSTRQHHLPSLVDVPEMPPALWEQVLNYNDSMRLTCFCSE